MADQDVPALPRPMTMGHRLAIVGANMVALAILAGIFLGNKESLPFNINTSQDIRTICLALWAFIVPSWWTLEEELWPGSALHQKGARLLWVLVGGLSFIVIGTVPPKP